VRYVLLVSCKKTSCIFKLSCCCFEKGSHYVAQLTSNLRSSFLSFLSAGIVGVYHHTWLLHGFKCSLHEFNFRNCEHIGFFKVCVADIVLFQTAPVSIVISAFNNEWVSLKLIDHYADLPSYGHVTCILMGNLLYFPLAQPRCRCTWKYRSP
jgi:hypothetical protein